MASSAKRTRSSSGKMSRKSHHEGKERVNGNGENGHGEEEEELAQTEKAPVVQESGVQVEVEREDLQIQHFTLAAVDADGEFLITARGNKVRGVFNH